MDNELLNLIIKACAGLIAAQLVGFIFILGRLVIRLVVQKLEVSQFAWVVALVKRAVLEAEQMGLDKQVKTLIKTTGEEKFDYAMQTIVDELDKSKIYLDRDGISKLIKASVYDELNRQKVIGV